MQRDQRDKSKKSATPEPEKKERLNSPLWRSSGQFAAAMRAPVEGDGPSFEGDVLHARQALVDSLRQVRVATASMPPDPAVHAATQSVLERLKDVEALEHAITEACLETRDDRLISLTLDGAFAEYIRSLFAWGLAVVRALDELVADLKRLAPEWPKLRERLVEAEGFYLAALEPEVIEQVERLRVEREQLGDYQPLPPQTQQKIEELFLSAAGLQQGLEKRFG